MRLINKFLLFLIITILGNSAYAQQVISGTVIDAKTKAPLAFVNIVFDHHPNSGVVSNIDGKFTYHTPSVVKTLTCSYVGYEKITINLESKEKTNQLIISLKASQLDLKGVTIIAGENPANRIIRKVIDNKKINNPENIPSFSYTSYNKVIYDLNPNDSLGANDKQQKLDETLQGGHMLIMESVTERERLKSDRDNETILATKVSGFKHPSFAAIATDLQPFSFYNDIITLFDINYLNPISNGSLSKYLFYLEDTSYQQSDTTFILSFKPKPNKNFEGLIGLLYINTNNYAIQNVIAEPFEKGLIDMKIQQKYQFIDNKQWFPEQLNFELIISQYPSKDLGMIANGKSYIKQVKLNPELIKKDFSLESITMHALANERDSLFWEKHRNEALNEAEKITYQVIDSIGKANKFDATLTFAEKAAFGILPLSILDIDLSKTFLFNQFEGYRLGLGAYTNEKISKYVSVGGFFGYGLKDHQWKYGGGIKL